MQKGAILNIGNQSNVKDPITRIFTRLGTKLHKRKFKDFDLSQIRVFVRQDDQHVRPLAEVGQLQYLGIQMRNFDWLQICKHSQVLN